MEASTWYDEQPIAPDVGGARARLLRTNSETIAAKRRAQLAIEGAMVVEDRTYWDGEQVWLLKWWSK